MNIQPRSLAGCRLDFQGSPDRVEAFPHADQAEPSIPGCRNIETNPIVGDRDDTAFPIASFAHENLRIGSTTREFDGILQHIAKRDREIMELVSEAKDDCDEKKRRDRERDRSLHHLVQDDDAKTVRLVRGRSAHRLVRRRRVRVVVADQATMRVVADPEPARVVGCDARAVVRREHHLERHQCAHHADAQDLVGETRIAAKVDVAEHRVVREE